MESLEQLEQMLRREFNLQGLYPKDIIIKACAKMLHNENTEWGDIAITAFVLGYIFKKHLG